jgi:hypothetical protein
LRSPIANKGDIKDVDKFLDELRGKLDQLKRELDPNWTEEDEEAPVFAQEAFNEEKGAEAAAESDKPMEL